MNLDDNMRSRLRELANEEHSELSAAARARVIERLPSEPKRRVGWHLFWVAPALLALVAVVASLRVWEPSADRSRASSAADPATVSAPLAEVETAPRATNAATSTNVRAASACASLGGEFRAGPSRDLVLDLASRALLVHTPASEVDALRADTCSIALTLRHGLVMVHARDLQGTELVVHTSLAEVKVRGTVFSVEASRDDGKVVVAVDEGVVEVTRHGSSARELVHPGQRLTVVAAQVSTRDPATPGERRALRQHLGLAPATAKAIAADAGVAPERASDTAPVSTEKVWREGALPAPNVTPEPGSPMTEDGRPMKKPSIQRSAKP